MSDHQADDTSELDALQHATMGDDVEYMFAQTSRAVSIGDDKRISLIDVSSTTLFFSDRPYRLTGHIPTDEFVDSWDLGDDSFADTPPNALLSMFEDDEVNDVVLVLFDPVLSDGELSYEVMVMDGELGSPTGPASLYIDMIGRPLSPMSVAGVRRRSRRRGRRRSRRRLG